MWNTGPICAAYDRTTRSPNLTHPLARALQIAAREEIVYGTGDSDLFEDAVGTFGSRSAGIGGAAVDQAVRTLRERLLGSAAQQLNTGPGDVVFSGGVFTSPQGSSLSLTELAVRTDALLSGEAVYTPEAPTFPNGCHICEVEIDRQTGVPTIARYIVVEDVGTVLNPMIVNGQIHGGVAQGAGQVLWERIAYEIESGQMLTGSFMDYAMPRAADLPFFEVESRPCPTKVNPLGVKGGGEGGTIGALPALQNAIADALRPFGVRDIPMPATAGSLWQLMKGG
jgi:carbon-monoxide dehydrogenase large subunit